MALQGSLADFALPDVLALLASTGKTGELHVRGLGGEGRVWLETGRLVAADAGSTCEPVDALFELLRLDDGHFRFESDVVTTSATTPVSVDAVVDEARARLIEWKVIEAAVPSLDTRVRLVREAPSSPVVIDPEQWSVLVALAEGGDVRSVARTLDEGEFTACRLVKGLVDAGLVSVVEGDPVASDEDYPLPSEGIDLDSLVEIPNRRRGGFEEVQTSEQSDVEEVELSPIKRLAAAAARRDEDAEHSSEEESPVDSEEDPIEPVKLEVTADLQEPVEESTSAETPTPEATGGDDPGMAADALVDDNGEPINRRLLLKFLSSVRS